MNASTTAAPPPFKIGLAMAGAVSAGAYTAGVLDFLVEALDAWTAAKARGEAVPQHGISLEVASGASAGSMCAALLAILLPYRFPHVRVATNGTPGVVPEDAAAAIGPERNPLYRAWVDAIGIEPLLDTADLDNGRLEALLNCQVIDDIVAESLRYSATPAQRPWVARPFVARFTLGNLRGVPYAIDFRGGQKGHPDAMREQADWRGFRIGDTAPPANDPPSYANFLYAHRALPALPLQDAAGWQALGAAAVASGAFPLFLKPRLIEAAGRDYAARHFAEAAPASGGDPEAIPPAWEDRRVPESFVFASADGGIFDNEPFQLAHEVIAGGRGKSNPRGAKDANAAVLMVAPFLDEPDNGAPPPLKDGRLDLPPLAQIWPLIRAWIAQSRFKPAELTLAYDNGIYSRFVIAPSKSGAPEKATSWLASGALGGFFGFFSREYRKHDFQLGRRNCQRFLAQWFTVPAENTIVGAGYAHLDAATLALYRAESGELPIIPLVGRLHDTEEPLVDWPVGRFDPGGLMPSIRDRLDGLFAHYRDDFLAGVGNRLARFGLGQAVSAAWRLGLRGFVSGRFENALRQARDDQGL